MAPAPGRVELEAVVTKVEAALARLKSIETAVRQLQTLAANTPANITIHVDQAIARIEEVRSKLAAFRAEAAGTGSIVLKADATQLLSAVQQAERGVTAALDRIKAKAREADPLEALARQAVRSAESVNRELDKLDKAVDKTFAALKKRAAENVFAGIGENAAKEATKLNAEFKRLESSFAAAVRALNTESRRADFSPTSESARKLRENVRLAAEDILTFATKTGAATAQAGGAFDRLRATIQQAQVAVRDFAREPTSLAEKLLNLSGRLATVGNAMRLFLASIVVQKLFDLGKGAVDAAVKLELLKTAIRGLLGSTEEADRAFGFLRKTADDFGVSFIELTERFRSFAPAAREAGLSTQQIEDVFRSVAISARALGFSTEETQRALLAFQQILQKGKFQGEELTKQLGQLLPNALKILSKETGQSTSELLALMKQGRLTSDAILALAAGLTEKLGPTAVGTARTAAAEFERFKNTLFDLKAAVGAELVPAVVDLLNALKDTGRDGKAAFESIASGAASLIDVVTRLVGVVRDIFSLNLKGLIFEIGGALGDLLEFALKPFIVANEVLAVVLHKLGVISDESFEKIKENFRQGRKDLEDIGDGYRLLADESRGQSDQFADSWAGASRRIAKENQDATRRMREDYAAFAKKQGEEAEGVTKKEKAELDKREENFRNAFRRLAELASRAPTATPGAQPSTGNPYGAATQGAADYERQVASLQQQLGQLRAEEERIQQTPIISLEDGNRAEELRVAIRDIEQQLQQLQATGPPAAAAVGTAIQGAGTQATTAASAFEQARDRIAAALSELASNDSFREAFSGLAEPAQAAVVAIIDQFEEMNRVVGVSAADVADFGRRLAEVFAAGGQVSRGFAAELAAGLGAVGTNAASAADALRAYAAQAQGAAPQVDQLAAAQRAQTAAADPLVGVYGRLNEQTGHWEIAQRDSVDAIAAHNTALQGMAKLFDEQPGHILTAEESIARFGLGLDDAAKVLRDGGVDVMQFHDGLMAVEKASTEAGGSITTASGEVIKIGEAGKTAGKGLEEAGGKIDALGQKKLDPAPEKSVDGLAKASHAAAEGLQKTGAQADAAQGPLESVATSADKLSKIVLPPGLAEAIVGVGAAARVAQGPLEASANAAVKLGEGLAKVGAVDAEQVVKLGAAFGAAAGPLTAAAEPAGRLGTALNAISTSLSAIVAEAEPFSAALTSAGTAIQTLADSGSTQTLSGQLDSLHGSASKVATDFTALAKGATDFSGQVQPVTDAANEISTALGKLDLKPAIKEFDALNGSVVTLGGSLGTAAQNQGKLDEKTKAAATATGDLKGKLDDLVTLIRGQLHSAISGQAVPDLDSMKKGFDAGKKACADFITQAQKLETEAIPAIRKTTGEVSALRAQLEAALQAARELNKELAGMSMG